MCDISQTCFPLNLVCIKLWTFNKKINPEARVWIIILHSHKIGLQQVMHNCWVFFFFFFANYKHTDCYLVLTLVNEKRNF